MARQSRKSGGTRASRPPEIAIGAPAFTELSPVALSSVDGKDRLKLLFPGAVASVGDQRLVGIIPCVAVRVGSGKTAEYLFVQLNLRNDRSLGAVAAKLGAAHRTHLTGFALLVEADRRFTDLARAAGKRAALAVRLRIRVEFAGLKSPQLSTPVDADLRAAPVQGIDPSALAAFAGWLPCFTECHPDWTGELFDSDTWWTTCHGPCAKGKDCRCKAKPPGFPGFKICTGWTRCDCV